MKLRFDYVTNSSSASFVIARRSDCTIEDIKAIVTSPMYQNVLQEIMKYDYKYREDSVPDRLIDDICGFLYRVSSSDYGIAIGDWSIGSMDSSSEDGGASSCLYMGISNVDTDKFKIGGGYC